MPFKPSRAVVVNVTIIMEAGLLLVATIWMSSAEIDLRPSFKLAWRAIVLGMVAGCLTAGSGFAMIWLGKTVKYKAVWLKTLSEIVLTELAPIFSEVDWPDIMLLAIASGICEEIFFRGVLQFEVGVVLASLLFGIFHCPSLRHLPYAVWAASAGMFLGFLYLWTGSLWTPILAHSLSNFIVLLYLRYRIKPDESLAP